MRQTDFLDKYRNYMMNTLQSPAKRSGDILIRFLLIFMAVWMLSALPAVAAEAVEAVQTAQTAVEATAESTKPLIDWAEVKYVTVQLLTGFKLTLALFFLTLICALPLGLVFAFGTMSKITPLRWLVKGIVYIIRGTPLLLQLMIIVYIPGIVFHHPLTRWAIFGGNVPLAYFFGALVAFIINYACYFSEIYRGGIESIAKGQYEAGQVLGMTKTQIFFRIILLQVIKNILPPIANETITLVKDTALARTVSVMEILFMANEILALKQLIWPLFYTGVFYLAFNAIVTWIFGKLEAKLSYYKV